MTSTQSTPKTWTTRSLVAWMQQAFHERGLDGPRLLAEMLMAHVLGCDRLRLYLDPDRPASPLERQTLRELVARALRHEPVQYLVGEAWFFGLPFKVDPRVLIPRPCTQTIVEYVLQHHRASHGPSQTASPVRGEGLLIADVCTGSGAIAIALAKHLPGARVVASDISPDALEVARLNAQRHGVEDRVDFVRGDLLMPIRDFPPASGPARLDYLVSNPPYIPDDQWPGQVDANVRDHEPELALRGGPDGMRMVAPLVDEGAALLKPGGLMLIELASVRAPDALRRASAHALLANPSILSDQDGLPRVLVATRAPVRA